MATPPDFTNGTPLDASSLNKIGMHLVTAATFSGTGAIILNNCFTSDYLNYRVVYTITNSNGQAGYVLRLRAGGSDSVSSYSSVGTWMYLSAGSGFNNIVANQNGSFITIGATNSASSAGGGIIDFLQPQTNTFTRIHSEGSAVTNNTGHENYSMTGTHFAFYQADGFSIIGLSGLALTGSIKVYGYRN